MRPLTRHDMSVFWPTSELRHNIECNDPIYASIKQLAAYKYYSRITCAAFTQIIGINIADGASIWASLPMVRCFYSGWHLRQNCFWLYVRVTTFVRRRGSNYWKFMLSCRFLMYLCVTFCQIDKIKLLNLYYWHGDAYMTLIDATTLTF